MRVGKSSQKIGYDEIRRLALLASKVYWDGRVCEGASLEDIDEGKVKWFLDERDRNRNVAKPIDMDHEKLLINIGAVKSFNGDMKPTNAGILFFGKNPQRFFINSGLRVAKFKGTDTTHPVIDRIDCKGTLGEIVNVAEEFIRRNIKLLSFRVPTSFQREDKFEYPIDALREALINALIHRDYQEPADVRAFLFDTHAEIINPGTFPNGVTPKHPIHKPVNPILCSLMYDIGFIEKYGSGIKLMRRLCEEGGNKKPDYDLHPFETKIVFESQFKETTYIEVIDASDKLNERQKKALYFAQKKGLITRKEYMDLNSVSNKTAYNELKDMAENGFVTIMGKGRGVKYVIKGND
jgi:ATP-dependent DNA helicase RecG